MVIKINNILIKNIILYYVIMYTEIIFIIIIISLIIYFNKKIKETFIEKDNTELLQVINHFYYNDTTNEKLNNINNNIYFDDDNNIDISGSMNIKNNGYLLNTDIRQYLMGCTLYHMNTNNNLSLQANNGNKLDLFIGFYNFEELGDGTFNNYADAIVVYPGFGLYAWENYFKAGPTDTGQTINIENYGTKPLKINLLNGNPMTHYELPINVPDAHIKKTNILYNTNGTTYKVVKSEKFTDMRNIISTMNVYLIPMQKWLTHSKF